MSGRSRLAGDLSGRDDVPALLARLAAVSDGTYASEPNGADEVRELVAARSA